MAKTKKNSHVGWPLTVFILSVVMAILGLVKVGSSSTFLLLAIYLMASAIFIRTL